MFAAIIDFFFLSFQNAHYKKKEISILLLFLEKENYVLQLEKQRIVDI